MGRYLKFALFFIQKQNEYNKNLDGYSRNNIRFKRPEYRK